eukprot:CAMPEP_0175128532 /NCGR_PEP_ID=MMETSP0087-20121206/4978_1 /TAXON_ID=136419 /ORGANISM="Unknown Unknown, Strain D1" /LENGTH=390 /DNA_ID=CAMNT_0016410599 /DNA_START=430 /DNA_END=1602 /DNA_ORIENTATION=-
MQYRLTDHIADPEGTNQKFTESLVRLPGPFLCYTPTDTLPPLPSQPPVCASGVVTFGSFNGLAKVNDRVIRAWAAILSLVPRSRLLLKAKPFASATVRRRMEVRLSRAGVPTSQVDLMPLVPSTAGHLSVYDNVDISIDTFPYAGTTTTFEALVMGVPVVTYAPAPPLFNHAHSVGATILSRLGCVADLVAHSEQEYIQIAVSLAQSVDRLRSLRKNLRQTLLSSPLCDGPTFVKGLEQTLLSMYHLHNTTTISSSSSSCATCDISGTSVMQHGHGHVGHGATGIDTNSALQVPVPPGKFGKDKLIEAAEVETFGNGRNQEGEDKDLRDSSCRLQVKQDTGGGDGNGSLLYLKPAERTGSVNGKTANEAGTCNGSSQANITLEAKTESRG